MSDFETKPRLSIATKPSSHHGRTPIKSVFAPPGAKELAVAELLTTDVLVIGGGAAGVNAALKAADEGARVVGQPASPPPRRDRAER